LATDAPQVDDISTYINPAVPPVGVFCPLGTLVVSCILLVSSARSDEEFQEFQEEYVDPVKEYRVVKVVFVSVMPVLLVDLTHGSPCKKPTWTGFLSL
jgi:hypothetical protein